MADTNLDRLLAEARKSYRNRDKHTGSQIINEILQQDFDYQGAWQLLYKLYGAGQSYEGFRRSFTEKYYPDKLSLLKSPGTSVQPDQEVVKSAATAITPEKTSIITRLRGRVSRSPKDEISPAETSLARSGGSRLSAPNQSLAQKPSTSPTPGSPGSTSASFQVSAPGKLSETGTKSRSQASAPSQPPSSASKKPGDLEKISVLVVDDIAQTRENIIRSLRFQENIEVAATANNGDQAIELAKELKPDVVIMDVNMPDVDGISATQSIRRAVPTTQVVILTVQDDVDYIRRAMMAGARDFLTKPPMIDELVAAVQRAGEYAHQEKSKASSIFVPLTFKVSASRGKIITIYSPRGGAGCTTLATNLGLTLQDKNTQVVVVDGNLQYGDVLVFFNVQTKNSILDLAPRADELDQELVESVLADHPSGIKLLGPPRPELSESVTALQFSQLIRYFSELYPYVIIDTTHRLTDITIAALDISDLIVLVTTQDIPSISRTRKFLDLAPLLNIDPKHIFALMNRFDQRIGITPEKVSQAFNLEISAIIPAANDIVLTSINRGQPYILQRDVLSRPIAQATIQVSQAILQKLDQLEQEPPNSSS